MSIIAPVWWPVVCRILAAIFGGYVFSYAFTAALARLLPLPEQDAVIVATLPAFAVYPLAILWAFACRNAARAWWLLAWAAPLALVGFWPQVTRALA